MNPPDGRLSTYVPRFEDEVSTPGEYNAFYSPRSGAQPGSPAESGEYGRFSLRGLGSPCIGEVGGGSPRPSGGSSATTQSRLNEKVQVQVARPVTAYATSSSEYGKDSPLRGGLEKERQGGRALFHRPAGRSTDTEYLGVYGSSAISCHVQRSRAPCLL